MTEKQQDFEQLFVNGTRDLQNGQPRKAVPLLERAHELRPDDVDAALNLGGALILTKKFRKAVSILEPLSTEHPENAMIWINLGAAYLGNPVLARDDEQRRAISAFERALDINPVAHSVAYNIGLIYRDRREFDEAIYWFNQAVQHNPQDDDARRMLKKLQDFAAG
ncbi:MAG: tetratricopeptide repeat protein [Candidatus Promineifilaceae bacterium]|nr:tetratricopeptide repeat protein [Candidatus Promineifilaceae bacterium]